MKMKFFLAMILLFGIIACIHAETFTPNEGIFAYQEVEVYELNEINFTVPTTYDLAYEDSSEMQFKHDKEKLKITVVKDGKVKKVKENKSKNLTSGKTMLGSKEGYLVDRNGAYTFSYKQDDKLVTIKSRDMSLMIGIIDTNYTSLGGK